MTQQWTPEDSEMQDLRAKREAKTRELQTELLRGFITGQLIDAGYSVSQLGVEGMYTVSAPENALVSAILTIHTSA